MASDKQIMNLFEKSMNPSSGDLYKRVGKRGFNEILGDDYDYDVPIKQIESDLIKLSSKKSKSKTRTAKKGGKIGCVARQVKGFGKARRRKNNG